MTELDRLSDKLNVPSFVKEKAAIIYRKALDKGMVRGRSINSIAAASLYAACRLTDIPRTLKEILEASAVDKKTVTRCLRLLVRTIDLQLPVPNPLNYLSKIADRMKISDQTQGIAAKYLHEAWKKRFSTGKDPTGVAAASLYIACLMNNEKKTQKEIAEAASVTEVTIRNLFKSLIKQLEINIPTQLISGV
jgi:transcription initiation factor TFIIB